MNKFSFDLQAFAWSHPSEGSWLYTSGSSSFYINGDYDEDEDDDGNLIPQNTSVSGSNVTIQPDWTTSISIVGGSFNFFDDYESFEAKLSSGDRAVNDSDNSVWIVNGSGYVYNSYSYYDSDITVTDLDSAPANRMTLSTISSDGFTHYSVDVNGAETSDYTAFTVGTIAFKTVSSSNDTFSIIPNIVTINFSSSGPTFVADDYDSTEYSIDNMSGIYAVYNSSTHVLNLIDGASYFSDATNLEINVDETSAGVKVVSDDFVSFVANGEYISINTNDPIYVAYDENSWVWDANANTLYFGYNLTMTGISNVSSITNITVTDDQIIINGATLNNAAIDDVTITGTDNNPSNGYIINITDDGYEFADDTPVDTPTVASISYNANGSFTFTDTNGNSVAYSTASVDFTTMRGALVLGEDSPLNITISSAADGLIIFDSSIDNTNIVAQLNSGDVFADDHIATDANTINAWAVFEDGDVGLGQNAATTISAITVDSTTTIVRDGNLISINNATLESFARINDNLISGSDTNPADGYLITISGDDASYITALPGALASIGYNGSFNFFDADGNALAYSNVSSLIATGEGGLITLGADAPDVLTVSSAVDDLIIFNNNGTRTAIMARINTGDSYVSNSITGSLNDASPINSWITNDDLNVINVGNMTLSGFSGLSSATSALFANNLLTLQNVTLNAASINGSSIAGTDDDPTDGYFISVSGSSYSFVENMIGELASIGYNGSFSFADANGNALAYSNVSSLIATGEGGLITLGADAPDILTVSSSVDDLIIYNNNGTRTAIMARINAGDSYVSNSITGSLNDASPINSWITNDDLNVLNVGSMTLSGVSGLSSATSALFANNLLTLQNVTLNTASINGSSITGSDDDPSDGYFISVSGSSYSFVENTIGELASIGYNGSFSFADANGNALAYSNVSSLIATGEGGLITLGADAPDVLTVSSSVDDLIIYNNNGTRTAIMARINAGDSYVSNSITSSLNDASPINSWITNDALNVLNVGNMTLSGVSGLSSATSALFANNLLTLQNVTLNAASINGSSISGTDDDPSDGYFISVSGSNYSFVENTIGELASIGYNGSFSFTDANGNALAYSNVSSLIATGEGGMITLGADAPDVLTVSSSVDDLIIFNNNGTQTTIMARINAGDSYVSNSITGSLNDASPINSWITNDDLNVINVGTMTLSGVSGLSSATSALFSNNLLTLQNVTLNAASINGSAIAGTDDDPSDGYFISVSGSNYSFVENTIGELASIGYNGSFSFVDANGNALAYSNVSSLIATGEGGLITLGADAPDILTVSSSVDDLIIFNNNGTRTAIMARINAGDSYVSNSITGSLNDASPINSWITNDALNVINVGNMTLSGVSGLSSATSALFANNLLTLQNVTLNAASINGSSIGGTDDDPSDGYYISVSGGSYSFVSPWSSVEGGFAYNANAINFTLNGSSLVDANADGAPDNVSVSITSVADVGTIMIIGGLGGEVSLNGQALGVSGDPSYTVGFIVDGEDFIADSFSNISGGSTVNVDNAVIYVDTEGTLTINDTPITVDNNGCELALTIADGSLSAVDNLNGLINGAGNASVAVNGLVTINGTVYWTDDPNGITVSGSTISGLDANSLLYVSPSGTYVVNSTTLEIGSDSAALGINNNLASTTTLADLRAAKVFALPDDTDFISADQVRETLNADGTDTFGGSDFDGNKIIELNAKTDIVTGDLIDSSGRKFIVIDGGGDQIVSLGGDGSNGVLVEAFADGEKIINAGDNGDTLINNSTAVDITLKGGAGNDSIIAAGGSRELIDVSNGGRDTIVASNGASIKGYDPSTGAAFLNPISTSSLMTAIDNGSLTFGNGTFSIEGNGETTIEGVVGSTTLNLVDNDGDTIRVMFGNRSNVTVGDDDASIDLLLYSDLSELTLLGGAGDDTIFAGENNVVDGGGGNDLLKLRAEGSGSDVVLSAGRDTVENFSGGWDSDTSDRLVLGSGRSTIDYSFSAGALHVSVDGSSMIIPSLKTDTATKIFTSTTVDGDPRRTLLLDGYSTYVATDDERADQYIGLGNRVGLNLSAQTTDETINLNGDDYQNIATITLGSGNNSLAGSNDDETIVAGLGRSTISSGDGNDVLVASTSDEKVSGSTFVYTNGLDTLRNFEAVGADSDTADEIVFNGRLTGVEIFGNDLVIEAGSVDQLTVVDGVNEKIKFNGFVFEVGDDMTCGEDVDAYVGLGDATLNVGSSGGNVWLNGVLGGIYSGIRVLDGSEATSDATLVGNELNNWIVGGSGNNSLWGGGSSNDTLNAGPGYNEYYYVYGDGEDVINNARDDDVIKLLGIGLEDIDQSEQRITGDAIVMRFNDGGSLTVYSRTDVQFEFKDGSRWSADRSSRSWYSRS